MESVYEKVKAFSKKYPFTIAWRLKEHSDVVEKHLNPDEEVLYAFAAQNNDTSCEFFRTFVITLTTKRLLLAQKRLLYGYLLISITPDMFNDLTVESDMLWGSIIIDTIKEKVKITNIQKDALPEIETAITQYMMKEKQKYSSRQETN